MRRRELYIDNSYGYEYVDLGLPSGTLWATCNIGARYPEETGLYFQWGEIQGYTANDVTGFTTSLGKLVECRKYFDWPDNKWWESGNGSSSSSKLVFKKYVSSSNTNITVNATSYDNKLKLEPEDDAAYMLMNKGWRMPTIEEFQELNDNCTSEWTVLNGVNGYKFTSKKNSKSIFFSANGIHNIGSLKSFGTGGYYWSSTLCTTNNSSVYLLRFNSNGVDMIDNIYYRRIGLTIRGVLKELSPVNSDFVDLGLSVHWAVCNIGAASETDYGLYFAWGEIQGYTVDEVKGFTTSLGKKVPCRKQFINEDYKWWESGSGTSTDKYVFKKYVPSSYTGNVLDVTSYDNKIKLDLEDDAAYMLIGKGWRMPTEEEYKELSLNCTSVWTTLNGVNGRKLISKKNNKYIFFPATGLCYNSSVSGIGGSGVYLSSNLKTSNLVNVSCISISTSVFNTESTGKRSYGSSIRGVLTIKYPKSENGI